MASEAFRRQVALLVRLLPIVLDEPSFALKGGTGINLFVRDLPRLSVDIDLTYLPVEERPTSLANIDAAMKRMAEAIRKALPQSKVTPAPLDREPAVAKLLVREADVQVKVEVTPVTRGCVYEPEVRSVSPKVEEQFGYAEARLVSFPDLYGGKIVAALDRQHPRDLFDVRDLLANEGISDELRRAFIAYLLSHNRPMAEVLAPRDLDLAAEYDRNFAGMTDTPVSLTSLYEARATLKVEIVGRMPDEHRRFLLSFKKGEPDWDLLGLPHVADLPAVRWKAQNLARLAGPRREALIDGLARVLDATNAP